jgi:thiosulfate/3-mercaptopyruvate sulfurtransferase
MSVLFLLALAMPDVRFVSDAEAQTLIAKGAVVLDARGERAFAAGHFPGAVDCCSEPSKGSEPPAQGPLGTASGPRRVGVVDAHRPVVVYGAAAAGFGEEGLIAWQLALAGHREIRILDGGFASWSGKVERGPSRPLPLASPQQVPGSDLRATLAEVKRLSETGGESVLLDVRSREEWAGAIKYGEARAGHIPRARHLPWTALLDRQGRLLPAQKLAAKLASVGGARATPVVVYSTDGVRSAFVWAVLTSTGYRVRNFDGSFRAWAADQALPVE